MVKKVGVKKKIAVKKVIPVVKKTTNPSNKAQTEKILIENFIALQKVNTNLSIKFDKLTNQISSLLELFEVSAKALAEKDFSSKKEGKQDKQLVEKIDNLLEQNRTIARGVALIHETEQTPNYPPKRMPPQMHSSIQPPSRFQKSISSQKPPRFNPQER